MSGAPAGAQHVQPPFERALSEYIADTLVRPLPADVAQRAGLHILDTLAAIVSGSRLEPGRRAHAFVAAEGGTPEALVVGSSTLTSMTNAAMANGMAAHADETDDSSAIAALHPGCIVVPAALAAAEKWGRGGRDLMRATAVGYDLTVRFSMALGTFQFHHAGHCVPGFAGVFGATAAAAALTKFDASRVGQALSYAAQQASGVSSWRRDPDHIEKAFAFGGMPARNGAAAVAMVASGMTGVADVFSGKPNFLKTFSVVDGQNDTLIDGLGARYEIALTTIKKWCVGSPVQPALDAVEILMRDQGLTAANVGRMRISLPTTALTIVDKTTMPDLDIRLLVSTLLTRGALTFEMIHDHAQLTAPAVRALASRIDVLPSDELERLRPDRQAIVEIDCIDGRSLSHRTFVVRGTIQNPMTPEEIEAKAFGLLAPVLGDARAAELIATLRNLESVGNVKALRPLLTA